MNCASQVYRHHNRSRNNEYMFRIFNQNLLDLQIFNFNTKSGISQVGINAVTSRMDIERSWNVLLPSSLILEAQTTSRSFAQTSLFHPNSNKTNNIQSDHQHSTSSVNAAESHHPIKFFLRCSNPGLGSPLVNKSPSCSVVEILSNLIPFFTISSQNQIVFL